MNLIKVFILSSDDSNVTFFNENSLRKKKIYEHDEENSTGIASLRRPLKRT